MNKETTIEIQQNGQYKNIKLQNKYGVETVDGKKQKVVKQQGINPGEYIVVKKKQIEGKQMPVKFYKDEAKTIPNYSYLCVVEYLDQDVSFFLSENYHDEYKKMPIDTPFKVGIEVDSFFNEKTGLEVTYDAIKFSTM
jgi:hypothetical protein